MKDRSNVRRFYVFETGVSRVLFAGLKSKADVEKGVKHILADIIAKDKEVLSAMRQRYNFKFPSYSQQIDPLKII